MTHDFKAALDVFKSSVEGEPNEYEKVVITALSLADIVTGEPSEFVTESAYDFAHHEPDPDEIFKAIITEAVKLAEEKAGAE